MTILNVNLLCSGWAVTCRNYGWFLIFNNLFAQFLPFSIYLSIYLIVSYYKCTDPRGTPPSRSILPWHHWEWCSLFHPCYLFTWTFSPRTTSAFPAWKTSSASWVFLSCRSRHCVAGTDSCSYPYCIAACRPVCCRCWRSPPRCHQSDYYLNLKLKRRRTLACVRLLEVSAFELIHFTFCYCLSF